MDLGIAFVVVLSFLMIIWYILGRRVNLRMQNYMWKAISSAIKKHSSKVNFRRFGSGGFQIAFHGKPPLFKVDLVFILIDRENLVHYLFQKVSGQSDEVYLRASFSKNPSFRLKLSDSGDGLSPIGDLEFNGLKVFSDNRSIALKIIYDERFRKLINKLKIKGISVAPEEPNLIVRCVADDEGLKNIVNLAEFIASIVSGI